MSVQRAVTPLAMPSNFLFLRLSSLPATSAARPCQHVLRTFSSGQRLQSASKRKMQTVTAYQPHTLSMPPSFPPLRNAGGPDTSIAGSISPASDTKPYTDIEQPSICLPEKEAQKSQPVAPTSSETQAKPRPKLRPRKAAMSLTPRAVDRLRRLLDQPSPKLIKIGVKNKGCSGLGYSLDYVEKEAKFDEVIEQDGVKVIIDSKALMSIIGSEMDFVRDKLSEKFVFNNPNIKEQCGCGESFMV